MYLLLSEGGKGGPLLQEAAGSEMDAREIGHQAGPDTRVDPAPPEGLGTENGNQTIRLTCGEAIVLPIGNDTIYLTQLEGNYCFLKLDCLPSKSILGCLYLPHRD